MSAEAGDATAQRNLGIMYEKGLGVAKDTKTAKEWYKKAIDNGNTKAEEDLKRVRGLNLDVDFTVGVGPVNYTF